MSEVGVRTCDVIVGAFSFFCVCTCVCVCVLGSSLQITVCKNSCTVEMIQSFLFYISMIEFVVRFEDPRVFSLQEHIPEMRMV